MLIEGQELWYVPEDSRYKNRSHAVTVLSIGRKWAQIDRSMGRIDIDSLWVDGGKYNSPGRCWLSKDAWEAEQRRLAAWAELRGITAGHGVPDISEATIRAVIQALSSDSSRPKTARSEKP